jgi:hypothetical protein
MDVMFCLMSQVTRERVSCERLFTLQRLKMNQKRQSSRPQSTKNACRKLTETLESSKFCGVFPTVFDIVKSPEKVSKMAVFATFQTLLQIASIVA